MKAILKQVAAAWRVIESSADAKLKKALNPGLPKDAPLWEEFDVCFDNQSIPLDLAASIGIHDGQDPSSPAILPCGYRLLSLEAIMAEERRLMKVRTAALEKGKPSRKVLSKDSRIQTYGPTLSLPITDKNKGSYLALDQDPTDDGVENQVVEVQSDGTFRWVASSFVEWLEAEARLSKG